jgi:hypothetical protein
MRIARFGLAVLLALLELAAGASAADADPPPAPCAPPTCASPPVQPCKICVKEPKPTTRKVYAGKEEEYCLPRCNMLMLLLQHCGCDDGSCCDLRTRHRLVVKRVSGCDTWQCVLKELPPPGTAGPVQPQAPAAPAGTGRPPRPPQGL